MGFILNGVYLFKDRHMRIRNRRNRDVKEKKQRQRIELEGQSSEY